tara:strand:+ start:1398 stop:2165 length:768 start_codon:yes stop_codon:yes gene_type:complete
MKKAAKQGVNPEINSGGLDYTPLLTRPKRVAIVALGPSVQTFLRRSMSNTGVEDPYDEVWTLNRGFQGFHHDKLFVMDDLRWIGLHRNKEYAEFLKKHDRPIITSTPYPEFPTSIPFPLLQCIEFHDDDIFTVNTVAYMVAYALYIGVKELSVYGADFVYKNGVTVEEGGLAVAYMLGRCKMHDCTHILTNETTMLYANKCVQRPDGTIGRPPYGYHRLAQMEAMEERKEMREKQQKDSLKAMRELAARTIEGDE